MRLRTETLRETEDYEIRGAEIYKNGSPITCSLEHARGNLFVLHHDNNRIGVVIERQSDHLFRVTIGSSSYSVTVKQERDLLLEGFGLDTEPAAGECEVRAPMPGLIVSVLAGEGDEVEAGDSLLIMEAMKMENELRSPGRGVLRNVHVAPGQAVGKNDLLLELEMQ